LVRTSATVQRLVRLSGRVSVMRTRPLSRTKRWTVAEVLTNSTAG